MKIHPGKRRPRRGKENVLLMDAQIGLFKEECAEDMGHRSSTNDAAVMDVHTMLRKEECALGMGRNTKDAAMEDAQTK